MKFTPIKDFSVDYHRFKTDNTYPAKLYGLSEDELRRYRDAGLCTVEGLPEDEPDAVSRRPIRRKKRQSESQS